MNAILLFASVVVATSLPLEDIITSTAVHQTDETPFRWNKEDYPNPQKNFLKCGRSQPSYICDPYQILTSRQADTLDYKISEVKNGTDCFCSQCYDGPSGMSISVAIVNSVFRKFHDTEAEAVKIFSEHLRRNWHFGMCDDDIVIVISTEDRQSYISSGETIDKAMDTQQTDRIFTENKNHFHFGDYYQGLESIIQSYYDVLRKTGQYSQQVPQGKDVEQSSVGLAVGLVVGFIVLGATLGFVIVMIRRRRANATEKPKATRKDSPPRPIVKKMVDFFPNTVYQPCSIEDNEKDSRKNGGEAWAQVHPRGNELSMVVEESDKAEEEVSEASTREATPEVRQDENVKV